jgi:heptaprenylglyceryl phosphate synthase
LSYIFANFVHYLPKITAGGRRLAIPTAYIVAEPGGSAGVVPDVSGSVAASAALCYLLEEDLTWS